MSLTRYTIAPCTSRTLSSMAKSLHINISREKMTSPLGSASTLTSSSKGIAGARQRHRFFSGTLVSRPQFKPTSPIPSAAVSFLDSHCFKLKVFAEFILVPFVVCFLITQDNPDLDIRGAVSERNISRQFGELVHPEDDDEQVDQIHEQNVFAIRRLKQDRIPPPTQPAPKQTVPDVPPPAQQTAPKQTVPQPAQPSVPPRYRKNPNQLTILVPPLKTLVEETITIEDFEPNPDPRILRRRRIRHRRWNRRRKNWHIPRSTRAQRAQTRRPTTHDFVIVYFLALSLYYLPLLYNL
ncbi:hypothetical protein B0H12DRAFT_63761 [Mycena haematopus]|nr:hypothetical protein B0H12DRAFT_63761 [Mycena haematopus]